MLPRPTSATGTLSEPVNGNEVGVPGPPVPVGETLGPTVPVVVGALEEMVIGPKFAVPSVGGVHVALPRSVVPVGVVKLISAIDGPTDSSIVPLLPAVIGPILGIGFAGIGMVTGFDPEIGTGPAEIGPVGGAPTLIDEGVMFVPWITNWDTLRLI